MTMTIVCSGYIQDWITLSLNLEAGSHLKVRTLWLVVFLVFEAMD